MSHERLVTKNLAGIEDFLTGEGTVNQTRNGTLYAMTKVGASVIPYDDTGVGGAGGSVKSQLDSAKTKVSVSADDTTPGYLMEKIVGGDGITLTELSGGGDEDAELKVDATVVRTTGAQSIAGNKTFSNEVSLSSNAPAQVMVQEDASADNGRWQNRLTSELMRFAVVNDAKTVETPWLDISRTGTTIDDIDFKNGILKSQGVAVLTSASQLLDVQVYTSGTPTWTKPAGATRVKVTCVGGGAGGCGSLTTAAGKVHITPGGGGGACTVKWFDASSLGATEAVSVGAGGAGGSAGGGNGLAGGNSTFDTLTGAGAGGISGGGTSTPPIVMNGGGVGATASGGDLNFDGGAGKPGVAVSVSQVTPSVGGDSGFMGQMRQTPAGPGVTGNAGIIYGQGGEGGSCLQSDGTGHAGGAGKSGVVIVETYGIT
jgi:hypothetical protein